MVVVYVTTAIGIPVYMHYCGGELEQVSFVVKSNSCCGGEEEDMDEGCCANENTFARYAPDFTAKKINSGGDIHVPAIDLIFTRIFKTEFNLTEANRLTAQFVFPPPKLLQSDLVKLSVLRI